MVNLVGETFLNYMVKGHPCEVPPRLSGVITLQEDRSNITASDIEQN